MTFTFHSPRKLDADEINPWNNLMSKALKSYNEMTDARYKEPNLREALRKAQLYNQYYGPEKESEMALRGKQGEHLGSLTEGQNISNRFAPNKLRQEEEARAFGLKHPGFNAADITGQLQRYQYLKDNHMLPDMGGIPSQEQPMQPPGNQSFIPSAPGVERQQPQIFEEKQPKRDPILQSILDNKKNSKATGYLKALEDSEIAKRQYGENSPQHLNAVEYANRLAHGNERQINTALNQYREKALNAKNWSDLPKEAKLQFIAIGQGAGIRADEVQKALKEGVDFNDLLYTKGYDKDHPPDPIYPLGPKNITDLNNREYASREISYLSDFITKATGEYANKIKGYSPSQVMDSLVGKNKEQQAQYLAARALAPELVNLRLVMAGAKSTVSAQKLLLDKSLTDFKIFESLVGKDVYKRFQKIVDEKLEGAFKASKKGYGVPKTNAEKDKASTPFDFSKYPVVGE